MVSPAPERVSRSLREPTPESGADEGTQTLNHAITSRVRYQLRHIGMGVERMTKPAQLVNT